MDEQLRKENARIRAKAWYWKNRKRALARSNQWRLDNRDKRNAYTRKWMKDNKERCRVYKRRYKSKLSVEEKRAVALRLRKMYKRLREQIHALLGGKCGRYGFTDPRALQVDHRNGNGLHYKHEGKEYAYRGVFLYNKILKGVFPKEHFQLLCANCNWIKRHEKHEYVKRY